MMASEGLMFDTEELRQRFVTLNPTSREDMKSKLQSILTDEQTKLIDNHNTKAMIFVFTNRAERLALKIEYGEAKVIRDEAHWYAKVPEHLKQHFIGAAVEDTHALVLLRWFDGAPTVEQLSMSDDSTNPAISALLEALEIDAELFGTFETIPLTSTSDSSFFRDKFYVKLKQAEAHPYLFDFLRQGEVTLNGRTLPGPIRLIDRIHQNDSLRQYLSPEYAGFIHGDLHADNLVVSDGVVHLVDPNGLDYLPIEYDHGRVMWSLTGWSAIVRHEHRLARANDGSFELTVPVQPQYINGLDRIKHYFRDYSLQHGLEPEQAYHRAVYSSAIQYLSRADHAGIEDETLALHLHGLEQLAGLLDELGVSTD